VWLDAFLIVIACTSETGMAWTAAGVRGAYGCGRNVSNPKKHSLQPIAQFK
jgi:hypothetical protein